ASRPLALTQLSRISDAPHPGFLPRGDFPYVQGRITRDKGTMNKPLVIDDVANQPPPFENINLFSSDMALQEALTREGGGHALTARVALGAACGSAETIEQAWTLEDYPPRLRSVDVHGRLTDRIEHHPAYHEILKMNVAEGLHYSASVHDRNGAA